MKVHPLLGVKNSTGVTLTSVMSTPRERVVMLIISIDFTGIDLLVESMSLTFDTVSWMTFDAVSGRHLVRLSDIDRVTLT